MAKKIIKALEGFTFGCDPELFVMNSKGELVSADSFIPGTKEEPFKVPDGAIQVDGTAAEFNIDPVTNFHDFYTKINSVLKTLKSYLPEGHKLMFGTSSVEFDVKTWRKIPDAAKILGCTPDLNAWTGELNSPPQNKKRPRLRTGSGHLHIGWREPDDTAVVDEEHMKNARDLVKQLDWYLGGWSVRSDPGGCDRRSLYGKAGACRYKPYGVEYRVLSNFWVSKPSMMLEVWNRMQAALHDMSQEYMPEEYKLYNDPLVNSINSSIMDRALFEGHIYPLRFIDYQSYPLD